MSRNLGGPSDTRSNALWGKGTRGGDSRSNALWGKGGRGVVTAALTVLAFTVPMGAFASEKPAHAKADKSVIDTYVAPGLLAKAAANPDAMLNVIVQSRNGVAAAEAAAVDAASSGSGSGESKIKRRLKLIDAVSVQIRAKHLSKLVEKYGLIVSPDARVRMASDTSTQPWTAAANVDDLFAKDAVTCAVDSITGLQIDPLCVASPAVSAPAAPAIAIVDSGVEPRADFGDRLIHSVNLYSGTGTNSPGDGRGHGTIVAGLAAGGAAGYAGAAPNAKLVSVDVLDDSGAGTVSDVIAAADWILANKDAYNIRVANFSLGAGNVSSFRFDPLNKAVEKLWFAGVTVVASAGNYAVDGAKSNVKYAPGNDPFVITVGASDIGAVAVDEADDTMAPWSAWGFTSDGFSKPEVSAPGRYMVSSVPEGSSLATSLPDRMVAPGYMRMSGTSFSAAVVSGAAAQILARHPDYSPDQVKGALMLTAQATPLVTTDAEGVGVVDAGAAASLSSAPNPNAALNGFKVSDPNGGSIPVFDQAAWYAVASTNSTWAESTWSESSWAESTWSESSWAESTWSESSWAESTWSESTWSESSWNESSWAESGWAESTWAESTLDK